MKHPGSSGSINSFHSGCY